MEGKPMVQYGDDGATFVRECPNCGRFVKADEEVYLNELGETRDHACATCSKCGRVDMTFVGYI